MVTKDEHTMVQDMEHPSDSSRASGGTPPAGKNVNESEHLENIRTISRVPNSHYYEKDGLRTYGDGEDHDHEPKVHFSTLDRSKNRSTGLIPITDVDDEDHGRHCYGLFVDWIPNSPISIW